MTIESIIDQLIERNIELQVKDGNLVLAGERERLTDALLSQIRENKEAIIAYLRQLHDVDVTAVAPIGRAPESEGYVLSSSQRRLWILSQFEGGSSAYHLGGAYNFHGALDAAALTRALHALATRHESLRTTFAPGPDGQPLQYIHPAGSSSGPALEQIDLRSEADPEAAARAAVQANAEAHFDLEQGPLLRVVLLQLPNDTWVLGYALHHLISDGWSMSILLRELLILYNACAGGSEEGEALSLLLPLPIQYKDYAYWQQQQLRSGALAADRAYWLTRFEGEVPVLQLPQDAARPAVRRYEGAVLHKQWPSLGSFAELVRQQGATLFMGLLAVVEAVLYRYSGQEDLVVGTPIAGRSHADVQGGIGFYVNTLALRTRVAGDEGFRNLLAEVRQACLEGYEHQGYPFDELVEELGLRRDTSRHPLFDVMVVVQQAAHKKDKGAGLAGVQGSGFEEGDEAVSSKFDLSFVFTEVGEGLSLLLEYDSALYEPARMERLCTHLEGMLQAVTAHPDEALNNLDYLSSEERRQLVYGFNQTDVAYPKEATLVSLFEQSVESHFSAIALVHGDEQVSYAQLNEQANNIAHYLIEQGIKADELVGICLERGVHLIAALLGVLKAGAGYVPIDPDYPQERIRYMIEDSGCRLVIDEEKINELYKESNNQYTNPNLTIEPQHAAYVIYTSGTTGQPKGVLIEHRNAVNLILSQVNEFGITASDNILQLSSIIFDASVEQVFLALTTGARLTLVSKAQLLDTRELEQLLVREGITHLHSVPSFLSLLEAKQYPALRRVIAGGEACDEKLARRWAAHCTFYNEYGPTETTVTSIELKYEPGTANAGRLPIGRPIANTRAYILNSQGAPQPVGIPGEIHIGGAGVARGYLNRKELTAEKFSDDPYKYGERMYRTGDWGQWRADGSIDFLGRRDQQVKLNGYRIELEEITRTLAACPGIREALVLAETNEERNTGLHAFFTADTTLEPASLRTLLKEKLPAYMVPDAFTQLPAFPRLANGKTNTEALRRLIVEGEGIRAEDTKPAGSTEEQLALLVTALLPGKQGVDVTANFFDLGLNSLRIIRLAHAAGKHFSTELTATKLFQYTSIRKLAAYIDSIPAAAAATEQPAAPAGRAIAIVGLSCQFPGSPDAAAFWQNICEGRELISHFSKEELLQSGMTEATLDDPAYVPSFGSLADKDCFDHRFFGYRREEAEYMDPQVRLFHEHSWKALEDAGYAAQAGTLKIGLFAGASDNQNFRTYMHLRPKTGQVDQFFAGLVSEQRNISSLVSYKLDLRGPAVYLYTACSTSLTAVHLACESLVSGECGLALAGGVSLSTVKQKGYHYEEGMVLSADGHCRAFDKDASGTVGGEGVGIVVLKPLEAAIRDRDHIYAVIKASSINNDGSGKIGYTAPGIEGQSDCIARALSASSIDPSSIDFIETHGTATRLGDPIEVEALVQAFGKVEKKQYCALGSVKSNMGHLDVAAGVASLIKTALALHNAQLPPSIHFNSPNPAIDFANSPFFVNTSLRSWERSATQRRHAGVSSFGIGGTNIHMILEDRPPETNTAPGRSRQLLLLSARTPAALTRSVAALRSFLPQLPEEAAADMAHTLQVGRKHFEYRLAFAFSSLQELDKKLGETVPAEAMHRIEKGMRPIVFAFPGQASQYVNMGRGLYDREPYFRRLMDEGFDRLEALTGKDFKAVLFADGPSPIDETFYTQPLVFLFEYALAKLLMYWGIRPQYLIGHSLGEYVAACIGGVLDLPEALGLVVTRAGLMSGTAAGAMVSVHASEAEVSALLPAGCSLAAVNGAKQTVVSGEPLAIARLTDSLNDAGISTIPLRTSHAYHSHLLDPVLDAYRAEVEKAGLRPPVIPFVSNLSGSFISGAEAVSPDYWVRHMREPVKFAAGIGTLLSAAPDAIVIEVGAGRTLISLMREHGQPTGVQLVRSQREALDDADMLSDKLALLWLAGVPVDWQQYHRDFPARRISLPTYSFEKTRHLTEVDPFDLVRVNRHAPVAIEPVVEEAADDLRPGRTLRAPETPTEEKLVALYASFFETPHISVDDSFIELGGDSLKAMVVIKRIREELGVPVALKDFFNATDISALAKLVDETAALMRKSAGTGKSKKII